MSANTRQRQRAFGDGASMTMARFARSARGAGILGLSAGAAMAVIASIPPDTTGTQAAQGKSDLSAAARYVFIPSRNAPIVTVVERDGDRVLGTLDPGLVPRQVVVSEAASKLVAIDESARGVSIIELANRRRVTIDLDIAPHRLIASLDGFVVAAADLTGGSVAFIELMRVRVRSQLTGLSPIRDLMFGSDGAFLYVAAERANGIVVVDAARGKQIEDIAVPGLRAADTAGLTRSPSGRMGYVKAQGSGTISLVDLSNFRRVREIEVGRDAVKAFPTGFGGYLVVPDNSERTVTIIANAAGAVGAMVKGGGEMTTVYSGWFDTLALVPSSAERKLLVYDLDRLSRAPDIALPGIPGPGAVTPDGARLYLALH